MRLIFVYGLPAAGKLTVGRELSALTGYKLFHNHLAVDLLLSVFEFGSEPFVELREEVWRSVFAQGCRSGLEGMIFTFAPERTVRASFVDDVLRVMREGGGTVDFVELVCPLAELKGRLEKDSRRAFHKLASIELFEQLHADGVFEASHMPEASVTVNTSLYQAVEAARRIAESLALPILN
jgi:hypothetical protein